MSCCRQSELLSPFLCGFSVLNVMCYWNIHTHTHTSQHGVVHLSRHVLLQRVVCTTISS